MNADQAVVDPSKLRDYLLSPSHPVGRFKATFFTTLGYSQQEWPVLKDDLLAIVCAGQPVLGKDSGYGQKYEVSGTLTGPNGKQARIKTVWLVSLDETAPRFVTAFPE